MAPDDLAYVVYTSGSTGRPKGVMIEHRNVHHMIRAWDARYGLTELVPCALSVSGYGAFFCDFLLSAMFGGTMVVCPTELVMMPVALVELIERSRATVMVTVPTLARAIAQELAWRGRGLDSLRMLAVGSEGWQLGDCADVVKWFGADTMIVNAYRAAETTVDATVFEVARQWLDGTAFVPIGRPLANTKVYVLDSEMRPVPVGIPGELYVSGGMVARGYWNRPELTAQRFSVDPFRPDAEARMYRTGDLVRWRPYGDLEFLGRAGEQVKIRGCRVVLGEVETALAQHPEVEAAAAAVRMDEGGRPRLVGYLMPVAGATPDSGELRAYLSDLLPSHAMPSAFVTLDALPLTPSGTVNRRALPTPEAVLGTRSPYMAPRTGTERALAEIWAEVLGAVVDDLGIDDDFFDLGGDSLHSILVVSRVRARLSYAISPRQLFDTPTIAELARMLDGGAQYAGYAVSQREQLTGAAWERLAVAREPQRALHTLPPTGEVDRRALPALRTGEPVRAASPETSVGELEPGPVPLTPIQHRFFAQHPVAPHHRTQSMLVELVAGVTEDALRAALAALLAHHDALLMRFERVDGRWRQSNIPGETSAVLQWHNLSGLDEAARRVRMSMLADAADSTLDLADGPLVRALLFDLGAARRPWLFLTVHHLGADAVSWRILLSDLAKAYRQAAAGGPINLGPKTASYQTWANQLVRHAAGGGFDDDASHWAAFAEVEPLPVDRVAPNLVASRRSMSLSLPEAETAALVRGAPAVFRTGVGDVLLAALAWTLCRWTGRDRVVVDLEGHGRDELLGDVDVSRTVGRFTTIYPVRLEAPAVDSPDWPAVVHSVRRALRSVPGNGLSHDALRHLRPDLLAGAAPDVVFSYHGNVSGVMSAEASGLYHAFHEPIGQEQDPGERCAHLLEIVGVERDGRLKFDWHYSAHVHHEATIERLTKDFHQALRAIAARCDGAG